MEAKTKWVNTDIVGNTWYCWYLFVSVSNPVFLFTIHMSRASSIESYLVANTKDCELEWDEIEH